MVIKMEQMGEKFIEGRIVNLDKEQIENLETYIKNIKEKEKKEKEELDNLITALINEN